MYITLAYALRMHHLIYLFSYFPISSYPLVAQNVLSDEPKLFDNSLTESPVVSAGRIG